MCNWYINNLSCCGDSEMVLGFWKDQTKIRQEKTFYKKVAIFSWILLTHVFDSDDQVNTACDFGLSWTLKSNNNNDAKSGTAQTKGDFSDKRWFGKHPTPSLNNQQLVGDKILWKKSQMEITWIKRTLLRKTFNANCNSDFQLSNSSEKFPSWNIVGFKRKLISDSLKQD